MLVLGIDPGYRSLGLALVDTEKGKILSAETVDCGTNPVTQHKLLNLALDEFMANHPGVELVATERPPFGFSGAAGGKTACLMWWVLGGLGSWAARRSIPLRDITPKALKNFAVATIGKRYEDWPQKGKYKTRSEKKWGMAEAVKKLTGANEHSSDHEADAVLAAFALAPEK